MCVEVICLTLVEVRSQSRHVTRREEHMHDFTSVGFIGAGLIWKGLSEGGPGNRFHQIHGLTTAASVWLSAALGVAAGGALYFVGAFTTSLMMLMLRFGPRYRSGTDNGGADNNNNISDTVTNSSDEDEDKDNGRSSIRLDVCYAACSKYAYAYSSNKLTGNWRRTRWANHFIAFIIHPGNDQCYDEVISVSNYEEYE
ncbi:hypothetical protein CYMTET_3587 [Cymbomonas tetramitiformis]|uniref:MgtC/SapB/SrpB/YhiD N-terminal domain-containing protein n=1 Tax=Cymbomonas tetramitiformis TaxID=36881 RepID=A0AAE0H2T6_9CHLO|nr:hypothetical protein CYMTET_3587 [Cymbomonas tetramitiformis]